MLSIKETNDDDHYSSETHHVSERVKQNFKFCCSFCKGELKNPYLGYEKLQNPMYLFVKIMKNLPEIHKF